MPQCQVPLGVAALVEEKAANPADGLSPQLQALMRMAEMQKHLDKVTCKLNFYSGKLADYRAGQKEK